MRTDAAFVLSYRPAKVAQPVLIECELEGLGIKNQLEIKPYDQSAAIPSTVSISGKQTLSFVVLPTSIGFTDAAIEAKMGGVQLYACAVTPLS